MDALAASRADDVTAVVLDRFAVQVGQSIDRVRSVRVHDGDELGSSGTDPRLERRAVSTIDVVLDQLDVEFARDLRSRVLGAIIDHDQFVIDPSALEHAGQLLHSACERSRFVVRRDDDCEIWHSGVVLSGHRDGHGSVPGRDHQDSRPRTLMTSRPGVGGGPCGRESRSGTDE